MDDDRTTLPAAVPPAPVRDLDWTPAQAREFGEQALDLWTELLERLAELPVARAESPAQLQASLSLDVPNGPLPIDDLTARLRSMMLEHSIYPGHPRFMAYISGAGTVPGAVADLLAAALNQNAGGWLLSPAASELEAHLMSWFGHELGLGERCGGLVTSGGAVATLIALKIARDRRSGWDVRTDGVRSGAELVCYASSEAHVVVDRAADIIGIGASAVRQVAVDDAGRMRIDGLRSMLHDDRVAGRVPFAVVGTAGTTATGAIDPLAAIADICVAEGLWFHVDGAYGAPAVLVPELRGLLRGIERADSVAFDPHKWLYVPLAVGCLSVRDAGHLPESFGVEASYIHQDREIVDRGDDLAFSGVQFSRGFAALKVWVSLLAHGREAYARRILHDVELARYMHARVQERPEFEAVAPVVLSIVCFRYVPADLDPSAPEVQPYLDRLNERLMTAIQTDGRAFCSNATVHGRYALRACIVNYRTEAADVDALLDVAAELGAALHVELGSDNERLGARQ
jgi:aromatic-L-amino-acid decarboxylase